jgi:hypothetical protein
LIQAATGRYTLSDIEEATNGFERQIGSGGTADVYYGKLPDGREIAAKSLGNPQESVSDFMNEVNPFRGCSFLFCTVIYRDQLISQLFGFIISDKLALQNSP